MVLSTGQNVATMALSWPNTRSHRDTEVLLKPVGIMDPIRVKPVDLVHFL